MNNPVPGFNDGNERKATFLKSLIDFTKEHRAAHWAGTFAELPREHLPDRRARPSRAPATSTSGT